MIEDAIFWDILVEAGVAAALAVLGVNEGADMRLLDEELAVLGYFFEGIE